MKRLALLLAALALAACGGDDEEAAPPATTAPAATTAETAAPADGVEELDNVLALRSDFEADAGKTRVILLLSPT